MTLSEELRNCIETSKLSRYAIANLAEIDHATMSRFMAHKGGLSLDAIDRLLPILGIELISDPRLAEAHDQPSAPNVRARWKQWRKNRRPS